MYAKTNKLRLIKEFKVVQRYHPQQPSSITFLKSISPPNFLQAPNHQDKLN